MRHLAFGTQHPQRGVASVAAVAVLLLLITTGVLYLTQNLVSEQRAAAVGGNRVAAQEAAEAGLAWATRLLNGAAPINARCQADATGSATFRRLYAQPGGPSTALAPVRAFPGCKLGPNGLVCSCPSGTGGTVSTAQGTEAAFTVALAPVTDANGVVVPDALRVVATGCSPHSGPCAPGTTAGGSGPDAVSQASIVLKFQPLLRSRPPAPLTCAGDCSITSVVQVINRDTNTNALLLHAGGTTSGCSSTNCLPLQGSPWPDLLKPNDTSLRSARQSDPDCSGSAVFRRYFYQPLEDFRTTQGVLTLPSCADAAACAAPLSEGLRNGFRAFVLPPGFRLNGSLGARLGSDTDPVLLVATGALRVDGGLTVHGLIFSNSANAGSLVIDNATVRGAVMSCGSVSLNRVATLQYASQPMSALLQSPFIFRRIAGSWTDLCSVNAAGSVTCR